MTGIEHWLCPSCGVHAPPWTLHNTSRTTSSEAGRRMPADRLSEARRQAHLRPPVFGVHLQHQPRGRPAAPSDAERPGVPMAVNLALLRRPGAALLPGRRLRIRKDDDGTDAPADQRAELRALQDLRHQGSDAEHRVGRRPKAAADRTMRACEAGTFGTKREAPFSLRQDPNREHRLSHGPIQANDELRGTVLKKELEDRLASAAMGARASWPAVIADLDSTRLTETEVEEDGRTASASSCARLRRRTRPLPR